MRDLNPVAADPTPDPGGDPAMPWPKDATLRSVEDSHALDWPLIGRYLERHGLAIDPSIPARQFAGGLANLNYLLRVNGGWTVLRRPPVGTLPPGANDMEREHRILSRLWRALPLAPRSHHFCPDGAVAGAPFQLLEFRSGLAVRGDRVAPLPEGPATGLALSGVLIDTLAALHAIDPAEVGLGDLGRPADFFRRTATGWVARAERAGDGPLPSAWRAVALWLEQVPNPGAPAVTLLHNDFKLDNILLDRETLQPTAVVDWDMGTRGDALFDVATLLSYWSEAGDPPCMQRLAQMPTAEAGFLTREAAAEAYGKAAARPLGDLKPYRVLAMLKLAVVFRQLHRRYARGETSDRRYADFGRLADDLIDFTLDVAADRVF